MRIKELLKEKGLTQQELADKVGVSYQSMKQTLNAPSVTTSTLEKIATALNVPMWQLFASPEEIQPQSDGVSITCPNCGKEFEVELKAKER
jgi:transcriptional regulator with XRE-family HTH domain